MECNRDEAARAKSIAESKLEKKDFMGAKKFALKAQALYPGLDGIAQLLTTLDVYVSAENKIGGEIDWYGLLGVSPSADDETIKKHYKKWALALHPDKNKAVGADGAFQLISEAWTLLSDKVTRLAYNQRRGSRGFQQKVQMHPGGPSAPPKANGYYNSASRTFVPKTQNNTPKPHPKPTPTPTPPPPPPPSKRHDTFWTICQRCKMHYEYLKTYLDHVLLCPNCKEAFRATETAPPFNFAKSAGQGSRQRDQNPSENVPSRNAKEPARNVPTSQKPGAGSNSFKYANYQQDPLSGTATVGSTDPSIAAKAANVVQQAQDKLKRAYTESTAPAGWDGFIKKRRVDEDSSRYGMNYNNMTQGNVFQTGSSSMNSARGAAGTRFYGFSYTSKPSNTRELTPLETRRMLLARARKEIVSKLSEWSSETTAKAMAKENDKTKESKKQKSRSSSPEDQNGDAIDAEAGQVNRSDEKADEEDPEAASMSVPDPDFHDFDQDRSESSFGDNEVWAAYDDDDGMPRFYALINKVISRTPFKLRISWLNSKTTSEFSSLDWVGSGFYKTCGEFRVGRYETCKSINSFSQKVKWSKGPRGTVFILPQKDDVWALYRNWSEDWNENTPDEVIHKYDMVTVLHDYNEEQGVSVAPLVKVVGFKTVFRPSMDPEAIKRIPKAEMFRFSHRVPYHLLTGEEGQNAPKGLLELDPAATPLELLQVITEANEVPSMPDGKHADQEVLQNSSTSGLHKTADRTNEVQAMKIAQQS